MNNNQSVRKRKRMTLIEILIVMAIIAMIGGALAYNYRGSLDKGKAFKSKQGIEKIESILTLMIAEDPSRINEVEGGWVQVISESPLVSNPKDLVKDGWGYQYEVYIDNSGDIEVISPGLEIYEKR